MLKKSHIFFFMVITAVQLQLLSMEDLEKKYNSLHERLNQLLYSDARSLSAMRPEIAKLQYQVKTFCDHIHLGIESGLYQNSRARQLNKWCQELQYISQQKPLTQQLEHKNKPIPLTTIQE